MDIYKIHIEEVVKDLEKLLGLKYNTNTKPNNYLVTLIEQINILFYNDDIEMISLETLRLKFFIKQLKNIKKYDLQLFNIFKKVLLNCKYRSDFYGIRMEINFASALITKKIVFLKSESPDFKINWKDNEFSVECSSTHILLFKGINLKYKVGSVINKKVTKNYLNNKSLLCIDITNLDYHKHKHHQKMNHQKLREYVLKKITKKSIGSVLLFLFMFNKERNGYESNYVRIDGKSIDSNLIKFLNIYFPFGNNSTLLFEILPQG